MTNSLLLPEVQSVLERLHEFADARDEAIVQQIRGNEAVWNSATSEQKAALMQDALLPVDRDAGRFLYAVARSISAKWIVEFGTSFGVSTIYFAAAVKDNGGGLVIGSELRGARLPRRIDTLRRRDFPNLQRFVLAMPCKPCGKWAPWTYSSLTGGSSCTPTC